MRTVNIDLNQKENNVYRLGYEGEANFSHLKITLNSELEGCDFYVAALENNLGLNASSRQLTATNGVIEFDIWQDLLKGATKLYMTVEGYKQQDGAIVQIGKSHKIVFLIGEAVTGNTGGEAEKTAIDSFLNSVVEAQAEVETIKQHLANGDFNGKDGQDYILSEKDKEEIADIVKNQYFAELNSLIDESGVLAE